MGFSRTQWNWIGFLFGLLLLFLAGFRSTEFWQIGWPGTWLYRISIVSGCSLAAFFTARLLGKNGLTGVLLLSLAEFSCWLVFYGIAITQPERVPKLVFLQSTYQRLQNVLQYDTTISRYDATLGYRFKPNVVSKFGNLEFDSYAFHTNRLGLRDDEASGNDPTIIVLGDSFTVGWGVAQEETFSTQLEHQLGVNVLNAGISSFGTAREELLFRQLPVDSCRLIILQYCANDAAENESWFQQQATHHPFQVMAPQVYQQAQIQNAATSHYVPYLYLFTSVQQAVRGQEERRKNFPQQDATYLLKILAQLRHYYAGPVLIISLSNSKRADSTLIDTAQQQALHQSSSNVYFLNVAAQLTSADNYRLDGHCTATGHHKVAQQLTDFIRRNKLL